QPKSIFPTLYFFPSYNAPPPQPKPPHPPPPRLFPTSVKHLPLRSAVPYVNLQHVEDNNFIMPSA
ncbi:MAG: hypothetical protein OXI96_05860, partial [Acidimicrobiaceae bacterium]|nr:hypothetical protein [Acidimicrobiaceae bacterium]